jgi:hypothetical protein
MATVVNNDLIDGLRGRLGKFMVFRTMYGKTFASRRARKPDKKKESDARRNTRSTFRQATEWAKKSLLDPEKKTYYLQRAKALKLPNAYTAAITDYMSKPKVQKSQHHNTISYGISKPGFTIQNVQVIINETTTSQPQKIVTQRHKNCWLVQYTPDVNPPLTLIITDNTGRDVLFADIPIEQSQN